MSDQIVTIKLKLDGSAFNTATTRAKSDLNKIPGVKTVKLQADTAKIRKDLTMLNMDFVKYGLVIYGVSRTINALTKEAIEAEQGLSKVEQTISSTRGAAGLTAIELKLMAESLEEILNIDADEIMNNVTNPLLTFTNITRTNFPLAQMAILNLNRSLGSEDGLKGTSIQVGKALNDPINGITALKRVGVSFSQGQITIIKQMMATNNIMGAQKVILDELNKEFGGQAEKFATTYAGKLQKFTVEWNNLKEVLGKALLPTLALSASGWASLFSAIEEGANNARIALGKMNLADLDNLQYKRAVLLGKIDEKNLKLEERVSDRAGNYRTQLTATGRKLKRLNEQIALLEQLNNQQIELKIKRAGIAKTSPETGSETSVGETKKSLADNINDIANQLESEIATIMAKAESDLVNGTNDTYENRKQALINYYEAVKFIDAGYYDWKIGQIRQEADKMDISQQQKDRLIAVQIANLQEEKTAWEGQPIDEVTAKYAKLMELMSNQKQIGTPWEEIKDQLIALKAELEPLANNPKIAMLIKTLTGQIKVATVNAGKQKTGWFWKLLGFNADTDSEAIASVKATYSEMMSEVSNITNMMISNEESKKQAALTRIEAVAAREHWSNEKLLAEKDRVNNEYEKKERKLRKIQQKMSYIQAIINTAQGVTEALKIPPPFGEAFAIARAALGAIEIKTIAEQEFAQGKVMIQGPGTETSDSIPARLSKHESVINAKATRDNYELLKMINDGWVFKIDRLAAGRVVIPQVSRSSERGQAVITQKQIEQAVATGLGRISLHIDLNNPDEAKWYKKMMIGKKKVDARTL